MKAYAKFLEVARELDYPVTCPPGLLRVELTLRGMELRDRRLERGAAWERGTAVKLLEHYLERLETPQNRVADELLLQLPVRLAGVYARWRTGDDLRRALPRSTFYRYRRQLLEYGIDIVCPPADPDPVIEGHGAGEIRHPLEMTPWVPEPFYFERPLN